MSEKSWKRTERKVAQLLGGERVPVNGRIRGSAPDIAHETLSLEVKSRRSIPRWIEDALQQATASSRGGKLPVAVPTPAGQALRRQCLPGAATGPRSLSTERRRQ